MAATNPEQELWSTYREVELTGLLPLLDEAGYTLDKEQLHTGGERFLMSGKKLVLTGIRNKDGMRVVIKASSHESGIAEIERERTTRTLLHTLPFAVRPFHTTTEIEYIKRHGYVISVTEFISQDKGFLLFDTKDQFFFGLRALEAQEGAHATAHAHDRIIKNVFGTTTADDYLESFESFVSQIAKRTTDSSTLNETLARAKSFLEQHRTTIERYNGFLTHTDFVPHNLRIKDDTIYLLDSTSIRFGNKYESWARFINYMTNHNPELEEALLTYIRHNRADDEYRALQLMRAYKLGFLLQYYASAIEKSEGDLKTLSHSRLIFWTQVLESVLNDVPLPREILRAYLHDLNTLRTDEERARQKEISGKEKIEV